MRILILVLMAGLFGCSMPEKPEFKPTENRTGVKLTVIKRDDLPSPTDRPDLKFLGLHYCENDKECTIWMPTGNSACAKEVYYHELLHVKFGLWHEGAFNSKHCRGV